MRTLVMLAMVGCAVPKPATPAPLFHSTAEHHEILAIPDETMVFALAFRGITLARTTTSVGHLGTIDGHRAVIVKSAGHTEGILSMIGDVRWELTTTLDLDAGKPLEGVEESWATFEGHDHHERETIRTNRLDVHAAVTTLRAWQPRPGERRQVEVAIGGGHFTVDIWLGAREKLRIPALRFDGVVEKFPFSIWISDDADRVPLRAHVSTEFGDVTLELVEYD